MSDANVLLTMHHTSEIIAEAPLCLCDTNTLLMNSTTNNNTNWYNSTVTSTNQHKLFSVVTSRLLADEDEYITWQIVVVTVTIAVMFYFMITDKIYPDWVMLGGLMVFMITEIITIKEGLQGFSNEGILTVLALFVVAEGISRTGALDYYMGKILGRPTTIAGAQLRLTVPIVIISAFFNNTPIVAIMIPVTLRWSKMIGCPKQQLLIPLSYATILGGTCTLVGTSTNLVLQGLLQDKYPDEPAGHIQLFDVAVYGVPNAIIGLAYIICFGTAILPGGRNTTSGGSVKLTTGVYDDLLIGARVMPYSPSAGRTVKRSGLNQSAGIYLVNVRRAITGNIHRAVSPDFVVSVGDELYFTGGVEQFGSFCEAHGLEILTTENIECNDEVNTEDGAHSNTIAKTKNGADDVEGLQRLNRIVDQIDGRLQVEPGPRPTQVIVTRDAYHTDQVILIAVDCADRTGLISDISDALFQRTGLQIKHSEANVVEGRSLSVWRCEMMDIHEKVDGMDVDATLNHSTTLDTVWTAVSQGLPDVIGTDRKTGSNPSSIFKSNSIHVVRALVTANSSLVGKTPNNVNIGVTTPYKAAIVAYQKSNGKNAGLNTPFDAGDMVVLAVKENSPLLQLPPPDFYNSKKRSKRFQLSDNDIEEDAGTTEVWTNLRVLLSDNSTTTSTTTIDGDTITVAPDTKGEFLTAFTVTPKSPLDGKTLADVGYSKLPGVVLVSCERAVETTTLLPSVVTGHDNLVPPTTPMTATVPIGQVRPQQQFVTISPNVDPLQIGDILWFAGSANAIADLQRVHGLAFYHHQQQQQSVQSASQSLILLQDRRLIQAVVARGSPLVGRTVVHVDFRNVYGGVVLAIQRGNERVDDHPSVVMLQTGDVLLIEADTSFVKKNAHNYKTFALISEVEDSSPPRPQMFFICLLLIGVAFGVSAFDIQSLFVLSSIVGIIMATLGVLTQQEARDAIQWDLFIVVASAFGISAAMTNSGVAKGLATFFVRAGESINIGDAGIYGAVYLVVNLLSSILTNNAAAVLAFPIAMSAVDQTGTDRVKMAFIIMLSASDYVTSFGYQTNLMVYGPGEYSNMDYLRFGAPMQVLLWLSSTALVSVPPNTDSWYVSWVICLIGFVVIASVRITGGSVLEWVRRQVPGVRRPATPATSDVVEDTPTNPEHTSWHFRRDELRNFLRHVEL